MECWPGEKGNRSETEETGEGQEGEETKRKEKLTTKSLEHLQFNDLQSLIISTIKKERKHKFGDVMSSRSDLR